VDNSLGDWLGKWVSEKCGGKNGRLEDPQFFDHQKTQDEINQIFQQGDPFIVVWVNISS